jgi:hypothetical protein
MTTPDILLVYKTKIRPILEYGCQAWHPGLTGYLSDDIDKYSAGH